MSQAILEHDLPAWMVLDGVLFTQGQFCRSSPHPLWMSRRRKAWQGFRMRLAVLEMHIDLETIDPDVCWAECRLYLEGDDMAALRGAQHLTTHFQDAKLLDGAVKTLSQAIVQFDRRLQAA